MNDETPIFSCTRADAIADGVLMDVTALAKGVGFKSAVAMTDTAFKFVVGEADGYDAIALGAVRVIEALEATKAVLLTRAPEPRERVAFTTGDLSLVVIAHHGDSGEPVVTILLPNED